jgi:hypothetical protein
LLPGLASTCDPPDLSPEQVARITGVSHWYLASKCL